MAGRTQKRDFNILSNPLSLIIVFSEFSFKTLYLFRISIKIKIPDTARMQSTNFAFEKKPLFDFAFKCSLHNQINEHFFSDVSLSVKSFICINKENREEISNLKF